MKRALITGITGQDGSYLAEFLLQKGYEVFGLTRRTSNVNYSRLEGIIDSIKMLDGDLTDQTSLNAAVETSQPDEVYNLGAQSFVKTSWSQPELTMNVTGVGAIRMLEAVKKVSETTGKRIKFYQASSSEMFGKVKETPQKETTSFYPRSPYGVAKVAAHHLTVNYRESYNMFAVSGILFNHESPRRGLEFVTKKITNGVAKIYHGLSKELVLGNIEAKRDWGFAGDYVEAMWLMLQQEKPEDFVIGTGETHSVHEFVQTAFDRVGLDWRKYLRLNSAYERPAEVDLLCADASKAKTVLGWEAKIKFDELIRIMVDADVKRIGELKQR